MEPDAKLSPPTASQPLQGQTIPPQPMQGQYGSGQNVPMQNYPPSPVSHQQPGTYYLHPDNVQVHRNPPQDMGAGCMSCDVGEDESDGEMEEYFEIKPPLKMSYKGIFQEPADLNRPVMSRINSFIYFWTRCCIYTCLIGLFGPIIAFSVGSSIACTNFCIT